ncbi:MAG: agmatinase [Clostridiales bacterium]|nr:MAG: agmatinase [Clostridiales bacterium]
MSNFISCDCNYQNADIVLFGAPFDGTTSFRPGTRFGPTEIRKDSFGIETYSPYQDKDLSEISVCDMGDLEFPFGNTDKVLEMIENTASDILRDNKSPVMLGGEHLITLAAVSAVFKKYPNLHIIHFDAHTDLRDEYLGQTLSHAAVMRRIWEKVGDGKIFQFGIRSGEKHEFEFAKEHTVLQKFNLEGFDTVVEKLKGKPVYFTLDLDILDPSIFPGTGTPEAGGVSFSELLNAVLKLNKLNIVGCDINELSPVYDQSGVSTAVACKILREILLTFKGD